MANEIQVKLDTETAFAITLASLANSGVNVGRQSTMATNINKRPAALIFARITLGTSPTADAPVYLYLLRGSTDGLTRTDDAGATDAALTIRGAQALKTFSGPATTDFEINVVIDTAPLGLLGPSFGVALVNNSGVALNATGTNHYIGYQLYVPEIQ